MRNLIRYPLTAGEVAEILRAAAARQAEICPPAVNAYALKETAEFVLANAEAFDEFVKIPPLGDWPVDRAQNSGIVTRHHVK